MSLRIPFAVILPSLLMLAFCAATWGQKPPVGKPDKLEYKITYSGVMKEPKRVRLLRVWLPHTEPSKDNLIKLTKLLRTRYPKEPRLRVDFFSSEEGAKKFTFIYEFHGYEEYYSTWRAFYWLDRTTAEEYFEYCEGPNQIGKPMQRINLQTPSPKPNSSS